MSTLKALIPATWRRRIKDLKVDWSLVHLHGPRAIETAPDEAVVTCLVKNGEFYLDQFIEHYVGLGFKHVCFLDNSSTDSTVERASRYPHVTIYRSTVAVSGYQETLKKQFAVRTVPRGWCLDVDIDEFFDYPFSDVVPLSRFLAYLNNRGYTAVMTQMLDMFSDRSISSLRDQKSENLKQVHRYYDLSQATRVPYREDPLVAQHGRRNQVASEAAALYWGGIRRALYGVECLLTKHSLFRTGIGLDLFPHVHFVDGARLADVSATLLHYKFAGNAIAEATQNSAAFAATRRGYDRLIQLAEEHPELRLKGSAAQQYERPEKLLETGFLFASSHYDSFARAHTSNDRSLPQDVRVV